MDNSQEVLETRGKRSLLLAILLTLSQGPYVIAYLLNLRNVSHYEFYPIAMLLFGWLFWKHRSDCISIDTTKLLLARFLLFVSLIVAILALAFMSPWASYFSSLIALSVMLLMLQRSDGKGSMLKFGLLLWVIWQPPYSSLVTGDVVLTGMMQRESTRLVSASLDWTGYTHVCEGNVIEVPGRTLGVAEACSGIQSLFLFLAIAVFFGVLFNRTWLHTSFLALSAFVWTLVTNTLRIDLIAFSFLIYNLDLSHGWIHDLLGYAMMLVGVGLISSFDQFLLAVLPKTTIASFPVTTVARPIFPLRLAGHKLGVACGCLIFCMQTLDISTLVAVGRTRIDFFDTDPLVSVERDWLPEMLGPWTLSDFSSETRVTGSDLGQRSDVWTYKSGSKTLAVSVDQAFPGWHELTRCYQSRGWNCRNRTCSNGDSVFADLDRNGETATIAFSLINQKGDFLEPPENWSAVRSAYHRVRNRLSPRLRRSLFVESAYQVQVFGNNTSQAEVSRILDEISQTVATRLIALHDN